MFILCLFFVPSDATEKAPWFGTPFEFEFRSSLGLDHYTRLSAIGHPVKRNAYSTLMNLSLAAPLMDRYSLELELFSAKTIQQPFIPSHVRATGRYLWMNDIIGDPISLSGGYSVTFPFKNSRRDLSLWYHGDIESEIHLSIGKEYSCYSSQWAHRAWCTAALGIGHGGAPWVAFDAYAEKQFCEGSSLEIFTRTLFGLGTRRLDVNNFPGYGSIKHRSIDVGARCHYNFPTYCVLTAEYLCRVYGYNFPKNNQRLVLTLLIPFSL